MNKMMTFLTAPVTALFHRKVYEDAAKSSAGRGVLYCLYLAGISTALLVMFLNTRVMPQADAFVQWTQKNMPVLIWTPAGLSLENGKTSAELTHPKYGKIALFDMTKKTATAADLGEAYLLVTAQKVYLKRSEGQIEERDITGAAMRQGQELPPKIRIDGDIAGKLYQNLKNAMAFMGVLILLILSFVFALLLNILYSLVGLLLNLMRKEKIGYGAIFNLTCFATGVSFTLTWIRVLTPLSALTWPMAVNILVNLVFMYFAFKITDQKEEAAQA